MAINRFDRPASQRIISQFVPKDMNMIARVLAAKQGRYDKEEAQFEALQDKLTSLSGVGQADLDILKGSGQKLDKLAQDFSNKDLSDPRIAKELRQQAKSIYNDPLIKNTQSTLAAVKQYQEDYQKLNMDGEYRPENDPFAEQLAQYQASGGAINGPLSYTGIVKGVDERKTAEEFFDNVSTIGRSKFIQLGDSIKKVGWEGITEGQIDGVVANSINEFGNTAAGQQAIRRFRMLQKQGQIRPDADPRKYLAGILTSAGSERIGTKSTSGDASQISASGNFGGGAFPGGNGSITGVTTITPTSKAIEKAKFEDGKLLGSGSIKFTDVLTGKAGIGEWWNDESVTQEDKQELLPLFILKNEVNPGMSLEQNAEIINRERAPVAIPVSPTKQANISKSFFNAGAGNYMKYTVIDPSGNEISGRQFFEDQELIDDEGNWASDVKNKVQIDGIHNPNSGYFAKGLHMSTKGGTYLVKQPTTNEPADIAAEKAFIMAEVKSSGVTPPINGVIYYYDESKPGKISSININSQEGRERIKNYK